MSAWNPGLESEVPREYLPLSTIFRSENVSTTIAKAHELSDYCGLPVEELVAFRAERLIVHELLIRVTTSLAVPDGRDYEDFGTKFSRNRRHHSRSICRARIGRNWARFSSDCAPKLLP